MGTIIDTSVFIQAERNTEPISSILSNLSSDAEVFISVVTVSELLVGVHRANTEERLIKRSAYVEKILSAFTAIEITTAIARIQARIVADLLNRGQIIGANDMWISATAIHHGFSLMTFDVADFSRIAGLQILK